MLSMPPATTTSASPARIAWAASMTAFSPEPHTLLTVKAAMVSGRPALSAACRAGFWPTPACRTLPMMHLVDLVGADARARFSASPTDQGPEPAARECRPARRGTCRSACGRRRG